MRKIFCILILIFVTVNVSISAADDGKFIVVIDPGHGGRDGGAVRGNYKEKNINLSVALSLGKLIESNMPDVEIVYTRKADTFVGLDKRASIANKAKANLFISIHTNSTAAKVTTASGADTYILGLAKSEENLAVAKRENSVILLEDNYTKRYEGFDPNSPESNIIFEFMTDKYMEQSLQFASLVQSSFSRVARRVDRGVKQAGFLVLRESGMPSVLIELGFINNPTEAKYLSSSIGRQNMASAIFTGLKNYKKEFDKKQGVKSYSNAPKASRTESSRSSNLNNKTEAISSESLTKDSNTNRNPQFISKNTDASKLISEKRVERNTEAKVESVSSNSDKNKQTKTFGGIEYRVQFLTGGALYPPTSSRFKGLKSVTHYKEGTTYKYTYGSVSTETEALRLQKEVRAKFKDAFIVRFRNNERIK